MLGVSDQKSRGDGQGCEDHPYVYYLGLDTEPDVLAPLKGTLKAKAAISSGHPSPKVTHTCKEQPKDMQDSWGGGAWPSPTQAQTVNTPPS